MSLETNIVSAEAETIVDRREGKQVAQVEMAEAMRADKGKRKLEFSDSDDDSDTKSEEALAQNPVVLENSITDEVGRPPLDAGNSVRISNVFRSLRNRGRGHEEERGSDRITIRSPKARVVENGNGAEAEGHNARRNIGNARPGSSRARDAARVRFLAIARERASHFAHYNVEEGPAEDVILDPSADKQKRRAADLLAQVSAAVSQPREQEDWPGPFSTARRLVEGRAAAAAARQEAPLAHEQQPKSLVHWSPSRQPHFSPVRVTPSLRDMCIKVLCGHMEDGLETLVGVPDEIRNRISAILCANRSMTPTAIRLCFEGSPGEVCVPDCSLATEEILSESIRKCSAAGLQVLELGMCGRGFTDQLCFILAPSRNSLSMLTTLTLQGGYRLTDKGLATLVHAAPHLVSLNLKQCNMISEAGIQGMTDSLGPNLHTLSLEACTQLNALELLPSLLKLSSLRDLSLSGIVNGMSDAIVSELAVILGSTLEKLSIAECGVLSDAAVNAISLCCTSLKHLDLAHVPQLTDLALENLADRCRSLRTLRLNRGKFSDAAVAAFIMASGNCLCELSLNSVRQAGDLTLSALAKYSKGTLELLDLSWCRAVSDEALGLMADSCCALRELRIFGCTQVTNFFLDGHSNPFLTVIGSSHCRKKDV